MSTYLTFDNERTRPLVNQLIIHITSNRRTATQKATYSSVITSVAVDNDAAEIARLIVLKERDALLDYQNKVDSKLGSHRANQVEATPVYAKRDRYELKRHFNHTWFAINAAKSTLNF